MNHDRRFWDELLVAVEESLAAFSGVSPDLIAQSPVVTKTDRRDSSRFGSSMQTSSISAGFCHSKVRSNSSTVGGKEG
jgi:hypothetical protein